MNKRVYDFGVRENIWGKGQPMYVPSLKLYVKSCVEFSHPVPKYVLEYLSRIE